MTKWDHLLPPRDAAIELGYPDEDIRAVTVEPDGTLVVTVEGSDGTPIQMHHESREG